MSKDEERTPRRARRRFLAQAGAGAMVVACGGRRAAAQCLDGAAFEPLEIEGALELGVDEIRTFEFPVGHPCFIVRLREGVEDGVGADGTLVAFSAVCPHRGRVLDPSRYLPEHGALGPCPWHNSAFDLKCGGAQIIGQANRHLPRVRLREDSGAVFAVGIEGNPYALVASP